MSQTGIDYKPVLYLSYDGLSDHIGQSQVLPYLRSCHAHGIPFHLVTFEKKGNTEKITRIQKVLDEEGIVWHRLQFTEGRGLHNKLWDFMRFIRTAFRVAVREKCEVIHSRSYFASSIALLIKRVTGKKLIFDKRDFWIDAIVETGRLDLRRFPHRIVHSALRAFERGLFRRAEQVISLTHAAKEIVLEKYPSRQEDSITVIPCCVDEQLFDRKKVPPTDTVALREKLGLDGAVVFGYVGSIGPTYMVPELLDCFKLICGVRPDAKLLFLVNNDREEVERIAMSKGVPAGSIAVVSAPREQMPLYISAMDYGIFFVTPTFAKKATSPTKQYEMLAMGKTIITNKGVGDAERVFEELQCGYLVSEFNVEEYEAAAEWVARNQPADNIYDLSHYVLQWGAAQYLAVYKRLLNHG
jgi:glycosyltransferase involved in cell wall biosynthesis